MGLDRKCTSLVHIRTVNGSTGAGGSASERLPHTAGTATLAAGAQPGLSTGSLCSSPHGPFHSTACASSQGGWVPGDKVKLLSSALGPKTGTELPERQSLVKAARVRLQEKGMCLPLDGRSVPEFALTALRCA